MGYGTRHRSASSDVGESNLKLERIPDDSRIHFIFFFARALNFSAANSLWLWLSGWRGSCQPVICGQATSPAYAEALQDKQVDSSWEALDFCFYF